MRLELIGLSHRTSPLEDREQAAIGTDRLAEVLRDLVAPENVEGAAVLSTCNRTELYLSPLLHHEPAELRALLCRVTGLAPAAAEPAYVLSDEEAVRHLARLAAGLDSQMLGEVQKKEHVIVRSKGKELEMNLLDMPGIATKVDYRDFAVYGLRKEESIQRAKEATKGVIEAIKWLEHVDAALVVMDATQDPFTQVNITILGNLEARKIPVIIVANKIDSKKAKADKVAEAFPQHVVVEVSALTGHNINKL